MKRRGAAMVYAMVSFVVLVGMLSFIIDLAHINLAKTELQRALDAATLAGCSGLEISPTEARTRAKASALSNNVDGRPLLLQDSDIQLVNWDSTNKTYTVQNGANESLATAVRINLRLTRARGNAVKLTLASFFGFDLVELRVVSVSAFSSSVDSVIVQDITSSFSGQLNKAKQGDQAYLDTLKNNGAAGAFGVVAQTGKSKTIAGLQSISGNYTNLSNKISSLQTCGSGGMPACSGTDIAAGIEGGISVFTAYNKPSNIKAMILVSDGEPTQDSGGQHPTLNAAQLLAQAQADANTAWNTYHIHIYVVFWNETNDPTAAANLATLKRGKGTFISVSDPSKLPAALENVARSLPTQLVQ